MTYRMTVSVSPEDMNRCADEYTQELDMPIAEIKMCAERVIKDEIYSLNLRHYGRLSTCRARSVEVCIYKGDTMICALDQTRDELSRNARIKWYICKKIA